MRQRVSLRYQLAIFCGLALSAAGLWLQREEVSALVAKVTADEARGKKERDKDLPVVVEAVKSAANTDSLEALGTGRALRFITLYPETAGEITKLNVTAGKVVKKGDIILELELRDALLAKKVAETKVLEAERQVNRSRELLKKGVNARANVDDTATRLARAKLELDQAEEALKDRRVAAPFDGIVGIPKIEEGDRVTSTTALMTLDDRSTLLIEFEVPELFLSRLKIGDQITAETPTYLHKEFVGTIKAIDSRIDPASRSVTVRAHIPNKEDLLRPGMSFATKVKLIGETYPLIPELALIWSKGKSFVWKIEGETVKQVAVRIIKRLNSTLLVEGALKPGDKVVIEGVQRLRDGAKVSYENKSKELF